MSSVTSTKGVRFKPWLLSFVLALPIFLSITAFQIFRLWPALPTVLQDEYVYSVGSKYGGVDEAARFGNFLYYELYGLTVNCGPEFYSCARAINGVWYWGLLLVLYAFAMRYFSKAISLVLVSAIGLGPFGLYVSLFMPEVMFFFFASLGLLFFTFYWESFTYSKRTVSLVLGFGAVGIGSLVKPHAGFLVIGLLSLLFLRGFFSAKKQRLHTARDFLFGLVTFLFVKLSVGFALAGSAGLTIFGSSYTAAIVDFFGDLGGDSRSQSEVEKIGSAGLVTSEVESQSILGYLDVLFVHFGVLILVVLLLLGPLLGFLVFRGKSLWEDPFTIIGWQVLVIGAIVSVFAAHVTAQGDDHSDRLLLRYFEYLLPFMFILGIHKAREYELFGWRKYVGLSIATLAIVIIFTNIQERQWGIVDSVFLYSIFSSQDSQWLWALFIVAATYLTYVPTRFSLKGPMVIFASAIVLVGQMGINNQLQINGTKIASDYAGEYVYANFPEVEGEDILVLGSNRKLVEASMFAIDKPNIDFELLPEGSVLATEAVADKYKLVVETTGVFLARDGGRLIPGEGFAITVFD